jgi:hypothetical protein
MPVDIIAALETAHSQLQQGAVQAADDLIQDTITRYTEQQQAAGLMAPPGPRTRDDILIDFARAVSMRLGSPPDLAALIIELVSLD